ncbi:MAG: DUF4345 domain-containing protein [Planctomycetes bacterium]|nr:DUF4345 domain-containing protein [Planctomycetota bacterium]MCH9723648.1 DUF4345 domain-containing protein [Planctomycetota bacterium]MCH9778466.1 DUF4345 domain-containing protein [Planctomycetota bacterium]MCH9791457.1 DUF4345 domain-containing protein [Planctomycetota bacterium]
MSRFYLIFSAAGLFVIALSYGVAPTVVLPKVLDLSVEGTDLTHIFRAIMGLYFGMIILWILGAFRPNFTRMAVTAEVVFMFGLVFGRILSIIVDGVPSLLLIVYAVLEIWMGLWGILILKKYSNTTGS